MTKTLRIGFLPLVDAALLIAAREEGFAEAQGLAIELVRDVTWANLRDRLSVGLLDAAHMLAPAAIAATLGLGHLRAPMAAPVALNLNGDAVTVSKALYAEMSDATDGDLREIDVAAQAFAKAVARRRVAGAPPPVLATVFSFSTHTLLIDNFLRRAGLKMGLDAPLVVLPPQLMTASLANGHIDGFCAGAPWNALAVSQGSGVLAAFGVDLIANAPEKLLVMRAAELDADPETAVKLTRAILAASHWALLEDNRLRLARHLGDAAYLDTPPAMIESILEGRIDVGDGRAPRASRQYLRIDPQALGPSRIAASSLFDAMAQAGQVEDREDSRAQALEIFRQDLFLRAANI
jgi:two-component system, oxyanion-binding sensor